MPRKPNKLINRDRKPFDGKHHQTHPDYNRNPWKRLRNNYIRMNPFCQVCGKPGDVVDHIIPVNPLDPMITMNGLYGEFLNEANLQTLCHSCHNSKTAKERNK